MPVLNQNQGADIPYYKTSTTYKIYRQIQAMWQEKKSSRQNHASKSELSRRATIHFGPNPYFCASTSQCRKLDHRQQDLRNGYVSDCDFRHIRQVSATTKHMVFTHAHKPPPLVFKVTTVERSASKSLKNNKRMVAAVHYEPWKYQEVDVNGGNHI